jgi:Fe-S-cluster containining protein
MSKKSQTKRVIKKLLILQQAVDEVLTCVYKNPPKPITCQKGCYGCCYLLVSSSMIEALAIVGYCQNVKDANKLLERRLPVIKTQAALVQIKGMNAARWFASMTRCAFLLDDNTCGIYPVRPIACRQLLTVSEPENCYPQYGIKQIQKVDIQELSSAVHTELTSIAKDFGWHEGYAPLPIAMMWAIIATQSGIDELKTRLSGTIYTDRATNISRWSMLLPNEDDWREVASDDCKSESS